MKKQDIELDVFTTAIEGGINYWAEIVAYKWDRAKWYAEIIERGAGPDSTPGRHRIDREVIRRGMQVLASETDESREANRIDHGSLHAKLSFALATVVASGFTMIGALEDLLDADTADMVVQAGLFGEVVYG